MMESRFKFEVYRDKRGEHRWRLVARNGRVVADSGEGYTRRRDCIIAIGRWIRHVQEASFVDA